MTANHLRVERSRAVTDRPHSWGGKMQLYRLVNLTAHDYSLEPNVTFTPDGKWIVFRSNLFGETHVYAVEVEKRGARNE